MNSHEHMNSGQNSIESMQQNGINAHPSLNVLSNSSLGYQVSSTDRSGPDMTMPPKQPCYQEVYISTDEKDPYKHPEIV